MIKRGLIILLVLSAALILSSCLERESVKLPVVDDYDTIPIEAVRKNLKLGVVTGPYGDMFIETVQPFLVKKGYSVELVFYDNYAEPNFALANGEIDLNMFQNYRYLSNFKFEHDLDLSAVAEISTASMGIFSFRYKSLDDLEDEAVAVLPSDPTNRSRALMVLDAAGVVTIDPFTDKSNATENNLLRNPKNLQFVLLDAKDLVNSLDDHDLAVINGNYAISGGLDLSAALYNEVLAENYINVIVVRTEDLDKQFVKDIITTLYLDEYRDIITKPDGKYSGFQHPRYLFDIKN